MKKELRIKRNEEFSSIISEKRSAACPSFVVYISDKKEDKTRIGISCPKKIGNAVARNKVKRQVREMFYSLFDHDNYPFDLICVIREKYSDFDYKSNLIQLEKLIKKDIIDKYEKGASHE